MNSGFGSKIICKQMSNKVNFEWCPNWTHNKVEEMFSYKSLKPIKWIKSEDNCADLFTKNLDTKQYQKHEKEFIWYELNLLTFYMPNKLRRVSGNKIRVSSVCFIYIYLTFKDLHRFHLMASIGWDLSNQSTLVLEANTRKKKTIPFLLPL